MKKITIRTEMYVSTVTVYRIISVLSFKFWWPIDGYKVRSTNKTAHMAEAEKIANDFEQYIIYLRTLTALLMN